MDQSQAQNTDQGQDQPFDSTEIRNGLRDNVPPKMRDAYDKVVAAGMKIMFDKSTHHFMREQMAAEGETDDKLAEGIASLMAMMLKNSKGAFPQQLIIPAGIELMLHAADFAAQGGGETVTPEIMSSAIQKFVFKLFEGAGVKPDQLIGGIGQIEKLSAQGGAANDKSRSAPEGRTPRSAIMQPQQEGA